MSATLKSNDIPSHDTESDLTYNLLSSETRESVSQMLTTEMVGSVLINSENQELSHMLATKIAQHYHPKGYDEYDIKDIYPQSDRYSTEEVMQKIIKPLNTMPNARHFMIVHNSELIEKLSYDKILKTIEEPPSPTTFILITNDISKIPLTILSRLEYQITASLSSKEEMLTYLVNAGYQPELVSEVISYKNITPEMMGLFLKDQRSFELYKKIINNAAWFNTNKPALSVNEILTLANSLASSLVAGEYRQTKEEKTPAGKSYLRVILTRAIANHKQILINQMRVEVSKYEKINNGVSLESAFGQAAFIEKQLLKAEEAERDLRMYMNPKNVLYQLFSK
ncbi:MAG: hypothetical protein ACKOW9_00555 [Candidatus Paceibacterota bacterium]